MSLPLGLYGLPITGNVGEETAMTQASNDAYTEFRRQMLSQVNATKGQSHADPIHQSHPIHRSNSSILSLNQQTSNG